MFNLLTKVYQPTRGTILLDGKETSGMNTVQVNKAGIARTFQNIRLFDQLTVEENVKVGLHNNMKGGMGNIRGSIIAATVLTILPEALRAMNDYRMLIYAIVLILVMLVTNNPTLKSGWNMVKSKVMFWKKAPAVTEEGGGTHE